MKKLLITATTLSGLIGLIGSASAADVSEAITYDWTGPYIGLHAGYGEAGTDGVFDSSEILGGFPEEATYADGLNANGILGGIQAGYNWQSGSFLWGIEADASLTDLSDDVGDDGGNDRIEFDLDALASLRLRAGFAADRTMFYVTGGLAYASGEFEIINDAGPGQDTGSADINSFGGVVGGGAAYAFSDSVSARIEGLYYFFGDKEDTSNATLDSDTSDFVELEDVMVVRAGLDLRF